MPGRPIGPHWCPIVGGVSRQDQTAADQALDGNKNKGEQCSLSNPMSFTKSDKRPYCERQNDDTRNSRRNSVRIFNNCFQLGRRWDNLAPAGQPMLSAAVA